MNILKNNFLIISLFFYSTPSPHRTPPPQRQGVIQRHNTIGPKPPSPAPNRLHVMQQQQQQTSQQTVQQSSQSQPPPQQQHHHYPPQGRIHYSGFKSNMSQPAEQYPLSGHEAFSSLVDVAVKQPLLPVPHKDEMKRVDVSQSQQMSQAQAHHEMRYPPISSREHIAMQQFAHQQQQQQLRQQQLDMQRRQAVAAQHQNQYHIERERREEQFRERERQDRERERERNERQIERERLIDEQEEQQRRARILPPPQFNRADAPSQSMSVRGTGPPNVGHLERESRERNDR